jgi:cytoskeletal protein RodZ
MDILASMLAYLGSVTGIVAALAISFVVYFSPSHHATAIKHAAATAAHSNSLTVTTIAQTKPASTTDQNDTSVTLAKTDKAETAVQPASVPAPAPTPVAVRRPHFECGAFNRSATSPEDRKA